MPTDATENNLPELHSTSKLSDEAATAIGRLATLTYQHRQLLRDHEFRPLLEEIRPRIRAQIIVLSALFVTAVVLLAIAIANDEYRKLHWVAVLGMAGAVYDRVSRLRNAVSAVQTWEESRSVVSDAFDDKVSAAPEHALDVELRLRHRLSYAQKKALNSGDTVAVARQAVASRRQRGFGILLCSIGLCLPIVWYMPGPEPAHESEFNYAIKVGFYGLLFAAGFAAAIRDWKYARCLDRMATEYSSSIASNGD